MPFKSEAQARLMRAVAHSPEFAKKVGVPQSVGKKFVREDKEKPMAKGKMAAMFGGKESKAEEAKEKKAFPSKKAYAAAEKKREGEKMPKFAKGGGVEVRGKTKGKIVKM